MQLQIGLARDPNILCHRAQECSGVIQLRVRVSVSVVPHSLCLESASYTVSLGSIITKLALPTLDVHSFRALGKLGAQHI